MERKFSKDPKREGPSGRGERREGERPEWQKRVERVKDVEKSPLIPSEITPEDLDMSVRVQLKTLTAENAEMVARHLAMVSLLIEDDPELAHKHALAASRRAGRLAVVHETLGITAYEIGDFALALRELLTHRRLSASNDQLPLIVDAERGMGRPEKALEAAQSVDRSTLSTGVRINLAVVVSGARLDLGQVKEAKQELEIPELSPKSIYPQSPLLFRSYAEVLRELGKDGKEWDDLADRADQALENHGGEVFNLVEEITIPTSEDFERGKQVRIEKSQKYGDRKPRFDRPRRDGEDRPRRDYSDRPRREGDDRPRREYSDRPRREGDDRPRRDYSERPRRDGDFKPRREGDDRPRRDFSDRPRRDGDDRPRRDGDDRPRRDYSDRPRREGDDRPRRQYSDRPRRDGEDRPRRDYSDRPRRDGEFKPRREGDDRPRRDYSDRPRRDGDFRPRRDAEGSGEDRPRRNSEYKPRREGGYAPRRDGDSRAQREGGFKPRRDGESSSDRPRRRFDESGDRPRGERSYGDRKFEGRGERKSSDRPRSKARDYKPRGRRDQAD